MNSDRGRSRSTEPQAASTPESHGTRRIVSPFRCRVWQQHSRPEEQLTDEHCKSLCESIAKNGQHQPALARPVWDDPDYDIEIICGARRHAVARSLGRNLLIEVRPMTDAEAYVAMYEENLLREGDSPYVRGQILLRALRSGTYGSLAELGHAFSLSHSAVSRLLMLAQLPAIVIAAFRSADEIREGWGVELFRRWSDEGNRDRLSARARAIINRPTRPPARKVYEILLAAPGGTPKARRYYRNVPIRGASGAILFHEQDQLSRVTYTISKTLLSSKGRDALKQSIVRVLEDDSVNLSSDRAAITADSP